MTAAAAQMWGIPGTPLKIAFGVKALDGANPTTEVTGLTTILAAFAAINEATVEGAGDGLKSVHPTFSGGTLTLTGMESISATDPTLVATSDAVSEITWLCIGV